MQKAIRAREFAIRRHDTKDLIGPGIGGDGHRLLTADGKPAELGFVVGNPSAMNRGGTESDALQPVQWRLLWCARWRGNIQLQRLDRGRVGRQRFVTERCLKGHCAGVRLLHPASQEGIVFAPESGLDCRRILEGLGREMNHVDVLHGDGLLSTTRIDHQGIRCRTDDAAFNNMTIQQAYARFGGVPLVRRLAIPFGNPQVLERDLGALVGELHPREVWLLRIGDGEATDLLGVRVRLPVAERGAIRSKSRETLGLYVPQNAQRDLVVAFLEFHEAHKLGRAMKDEFVAPSLKSEHAL